MARVVGLHTKRGRGCKGKAHVIHMADWSKLALLLINCSPNMLARRSFYAERPTNKTRSPAKTKRPNKTARKATQQASPNHPVMPRYFPSYSSSIYCPVQMWNGSTISPWYMHNPFAYSVWGHLHFIPFDPLIKQSWPRKMQLEMAFMH